MKINFHYIKFRTMYFKIIFLILQIFNKISDQTAVMLIVRFIGVINEILHS